MVQKASGQRLDRYLEERLLRPLGIGAHSWVYDAAGNPYAAGGLSLLPRDFVKIGQLVLDRGRWGGRQLVSVDWIETSLAQGQPFEPRAGLLWFRLLAYEHYTVGADLENRLRAAHAPAALVAALAPLAGRTFQSRTDYHQALAAALGSDWPAILDREIRERGVELVGVRAGEALGYQTNGYLGQYLVILPEPRVVAVRMIRRAPAYDPAADGFGSFIDRVQALAL